MSDRINRREFMKRSGILGAGMAAMGAAGCARGAESPALKMPTVKLGSLEVSRFILGSNPFWGYSHQSKERDEQMKAHFTDERIVDVLEDAAKFGVTALASPPEKRWVDLYAKYLADGGKLRIWIAQCHGPPEKMIEEIDYAVKGKASAVFIQGHRVEEQFDKGNFDTLRAWVDRIKGHGLPAGTAAHYPEVPLELEKRKFPTDFYYQCFYNVTKIGQWGENERAKAVESIRQVEKPVVAYKILAAGRLPAQEAFEYAFKHIRAKDGVCVGIYTGDAKDQIRQNALYTEMLA